MPLLSLLTLFGFGLALKHRFGISSALSLMMAVAGWLVAVYIGGLLGLLKIAAVTLWIAGLVLLVMYLVRLKRAALESLLEPVYVLLFVFCAYFSFIHGNSEYFYYDEYSHWGVYVKDMWALDTFWQSDSNTLHGRYPPAAPVWQYAFTIFSPKVDSSAYLAQFVLLITPLMALFDRLSWRQAGWLVGLTVACVIGLANFGHGIASLYVDHLISTWLAGILIVFAMNRTWSPRGIAALSLPLIVLSLIKSVGIAFAAAAAVTMSAVYFVGRVRAVGVARASVAAFILLVVLVSPSLVANKAWSINRDAAGLERTTYSMGGVVSGILSGEKALNEDGSVETRERFITVFQEQQLSKDEKSADYNEFSFEIMPLFEQPFRLTTSSFLFLYALFFVLLISLGKSDREVQLRWGLIAAGLLVTAVAYLFVLYASYLFAFDERGPSLPSYLRYIHSAILAMFLLAIAALTPTAGLVNRRWSGSPGSPTVRSTVFVSVLALLILVETPYLRNFTHENPRLQIRQDMAGIMSGIREAAGSGRVWVYFPADQPNGFIGQLIQFQLSPIPTTVERSLEFFDAPEGQIRSQLAAYDLIWLPVLQAGMEDEVGRMLQSDVSSRFIRTSVREDGTTTFQPFNFGPTDVP